MDRILFTERMKTIHTMSNAEINDVIVKSINSNLIDGNPRGHRNLIIVMEELAELSQEVSKSLRNKEDINALLEESADVVLCIKYIQEIFGITDDELNRAVSVKVERMSNVIEQDGVYL
jgi:NTP pyrophosphatase (non-canonical NTP hydrolase)